MPHEHSDHPTTHVSMLRRDWANLADHTDIHVDAQTLARLRGVGDPTDHHEVVEVYVPLTQLMHLHRRHLGHLYRATNAFLELDVERTPFVVGIAGSVAVGKSTTARLLQELLRQAPGQPKVELITTDGFLYPNAELERRGILERKGFPESYDRRALLAYVAAVKSGQAEVASPVYSHMIYDIIPDQEHVISKPDILIIEGLNVLQPARVHSDGRAGQALSDYFDFSIYVDAAEADIQQWFLDRFLQLRATAFRDPESYFIKFAQLSDAEATTMAMNIWDEINGPNLHYNIAPTRDRATAILRKGPDHSVGEVLIRKV
ncbi:type I pantothenate kinase [Propionibacteriaceae bacterium G1746]|uniref:type I pantothenate kinase n=1 Tax=Aestuariimicrobium sp. G57 TaxID=3418485 RepID=UPI003C203437